jgi:hypothetical protein
MWEAMEDINGFLKNLKKIERIAIQEAMTDALKDNDYMVDLIDRYPLEIILAVNAVKNEGRLIYSKYNGGQNFEYSVDLDTDIISKEAQTNINELIEKVNHSRAMFDDIYMEVQPFSNVVVDDEFRILFIQKTINTDYDLFCFSEEWSVTDLFKHNIEAIIKVLKDNKEHFSNRFTADWDDIEDYYEVRYLGTV